MAIIDLNNNVWVCGSNKFGQLGLGDIQNRNIPTQIPNLKAKQVSCGYKTMAIIDMEDNVWVCGGNRYGQLGLGDRLARNVPTKVPNLKAKEVQINEYMMIMIATLVI